jgi:transcriptional regulator with GAF, ATPase, and Fis domain
MADKVVKDHAAVYSIVVGACTVAAACAAFAVVYVEGGWAVAFRIATVVLAAIGAGATLLKFFNERAYKRQQDGEKSTLEDQLRAQSRQTSLLLNGAFLGTADKLRDLSAMSQEAKDKEISAVRQSIVSKVCDLVQSDGPRAAYFRVQDLQSRPRVMRSGTYMHSINREDTFTSEFLEDASTDAAVWNLIDHGDYFSSNNIDESVPETWDASRQRKYRSFVSAAVRADGYAFGMLTANTLETEGFSETDIASVRVLARMLAAAEATALTPQRMGKIVTATGNLSHGSATVVEQSD